MQQHAGSIDESNPGWYNLASDGSIVRNWNAESADWRAAMSGTEMIPTIQNFIDGRFNGALVASIVDHPVSREAHAEAIMQLVVSQVLDGIDIDYESVPETSRAGFTQFVTLLASKLHQTGRRLSVTVHPKVSDKQDWKGPGAQDWVAIGQVADSVKIMAYDYHWPGSTAGPITPLDWLQQVAAYATSAMDARKVLIGLPWYGYDWAGTSARSLVYSEAIALAASQNVTVNRDPNGEATFSYSGRTVFFQDAESYRRKVDLIVERFPSIGGFAHWRSGAEDPQIWTKIQGLRGGTGASPLPGDFSVDGPTSLELEAGTTASRRYSIVAINGFNEPVTASVEVIDPFAGTLSLSAATVQPGAWADLAVTAFANVSPGAHRARLRFTGSGITREVSVSINVRPAAEIGDFTIAGEPALRVIPGGSASASFQVLPSGGFDRSVELSAQAIDAFPGAISLSAATIAPRETAHLQVSANRSASPGQYRIRLSFSSGSLTHDQIVAVSIAPARARSARR